jgi:K+-transporting ATPase KdpF subunit
MKTCFLIATLVVVPESSGSYTANDHISYIIGGIIALFLLGYLIYSLIKPEKF